MIGNKSLDDLYCEFRAVTTASKCNVGADNRRLDW